MQYAANYDPYGGSLESYGTPFSSFGFTGEQSDTNGLLYLRARYYDSGLGGFLSRDSFGGVVGLSNSHNGYSYVRGNPVNHRDASGQCDDGLNIFQCAAQNVEIGWDSVTNFVNVYSDYAARTLGLLPEAAKQAPGLFAQTFLDGQLHAPAGSAGDLCGGLVSSSEALSQLNDFRCSVRSRFAALPSLETVGGVGAVYLNRISYPFQQISTAEDLAAYENGYYATRAAMIAAPIVLSMYGAADLALGLTDLYWGAFNTWQASAQAIYRGPKMDAAAFARFSSRNKLLPHTTTSRTRTIGETTPTGTARNAYFEKTFVRETDLPTLGQVEDGMAALAKLPDVPDDRLGTLSNKMCGPTCVAMVADEGTFAKDPAVTARFVDLINTGTTADMETLVEPLRGFGGRPFAKYHGWPNPITVDTLEPLVRPGSPAIANLGVPGGHSIVIDEFVSKEIDGVMTRLVGVRDPGSVQRAYYVLRDEFARLFSGHAITTAPPR